MAVVTGRAAQKLEGANAHKKRQMERVGQRMVVFTEQ